jgi:hypothetical protein
MKKFLLSPIPGFCRARKADSTGSGREARISETTPNSLLSVRPRLLLFAPFL